MARRAPLTEDEAILAVPGPGQPAGASSYTPLLGRAQAELERGFETLAGVQRGISMFGSARARPSDPDYALAREAAARLGRQGFAIITGGGPGIMEAANQGARDVDALSIGLLIELAFDEHVNRYLDVPLRFHYFFTRKVMFVRYASAFVVFPGGFGTLDELFELVALIQTRKVQTPAVVLVRRSYWEPLVQWLRDTVLSEGKISSEDLDSIVFADDADQISSSLAMAAGRI